MAIPTFNGDNGKTAFNGAVSIPLPSTTIGDLHIIIATCDGSSTLAIIPNGGAWTQISAGVAQSGGERIYAWWRIHNTGDGNPTLTPTGAEQHVCSTALWFSVNTFDATTPIEAIETGSEATSDTSFSFATTVSTSGADRLVFGICSSNVDANTGQYDTGWANATLTSVTFGSEWETNQGTGGGLIYGYGTRATSGACGTWSATMLNATPKTYLNFAVRPVSGIEYTDTGTVAGITTVTSDELYAHGYIDSDVTASATNVLSDELYAREYTDADTVVCTTTPSSAEEYTPAPIEYIDASTITGATDLPTPVEVLEVQEAATVSSVTDVISDELYSVTYVDLETIAGTTEVTSDEQYSRTYEDFETVSGATTPSGTDEYTPVGGATQKGYPISDITATGWSPSDGIGPLYEMINETTYSDTDYIYATAT